MNTPRVVFDRAVHLYRSVTGAVLREVDVNVKVSGNDGDR